MPKQAKIVNYSGDVGESCIPWRNGALNFFSTASRFIMSMVQAVEGHRRDGRMRAIVESIQNFEGI